MLSSCSQTQNSPATQRLQAENEKLCLYLAAQKKVIASLERRVGRSLDTLGVHVKQLTETSKVASQRQQHIHSIQHEVDSLCDLLADAMLLQKLEAGLVEVHLEALSLHPMLTGVTRHLQKETAATRLICEFESNLPLIRADQELLEAVLTDLLARGLRYSDADSPVVLGAKCYQNQAHLYVTAQRFAPVGDRDFATEIVLCCRRIEVQNGVVTCQQSANGLQTVTLALELSKP
jgi:signal transduction histidine kinase